MFAILFHPKIAIGKKRNTRDIATNNFFVLEDIFDINLGFCEEIVLLSGKKSEVQTHLPIEGALAKVGGKIVMLLGQQVAVAKRDGFWEKKYMYPTAHDFKWFREKMRLAEKMNIPIILFGDTRGADASAPSEYAGISHQISKALSDEADLTVPILSVNMGLCGSGGGLPFANTADFAFAFENSLKLVSNIETQSSILLGIAHSTKQQQQDILNQLLDASALFQKKYYFIDEIVLEKDKKEALLMLKKNVVRGLARLAKMNAKKLVERRFKRIERVIQAIAK